MSKPKIQFDILTLFPDIVYNYASESILKRAQKAGLIDIKACNFRDNTKDKQRHIDDRPYGGGPGMILQIQPIYDTLKSINALRVIPSQIKCGPACRQAGIQSRKTPIDSRLRGNDKIKVLIMDPSGKKFDQRMAQKFSKLDRLVIICGRYQGFDERVYKLADEKISVGDYVLSGGELPALTIVEAVSRLVPGVLSNEESLINETFASQTCCSRATGLKSNPSLVSDRSEITNRYPAYTRPEDFMGLKVPKVLLSGNHEKIEEWRKKRLK